MVGFCASVVLAGFITFALWSVLRGFNKRPAKVVKKTKGKANEPIECKITDTVVS